MSSQPNLKSLYQSLKEGKIRPEEAARQFKRLTAGLARPSGPSESLKASVQVDDPAISPLAVAIQTTLRETIASMLKVESREVDDSILYDQALDAIQRDELARVLLREHGLEVDPAVWLEPMDLHRLAVSLAVERRPMMSGQARQSTQVKTSSEDTEGAVFADSGQRLRDQAEHYIKRLLSPVIKLPAHRIESDAPLERYGIDSLMAVQLTSQLESAFGPLPKTLFFEYRNIRELTGHLLGSYRKAFAEVLGISLDRKPAAEHPVEPPATAGRARQPVSHVETAAQDSRPEGGRLPLPEKGGNTESGALDIAIVGMAGRYPGANNIQQYWHNLQQGKDCITLIPPDRWDRSKGRGSKWGGFVDGADRFDPLFFQIAPRDAETMDPQERLFLQCAYETLEDAGYTTEALQSVADGLSGGNVGVFVGVMYLEYQLYGAQEQAKGRPVALSGNSSSIANRVSYFFNFHGPSMAIDTMCSSSLTAIHLACQSLKSGGCELAIAGGVNLSVHPNKYVALENGRFASSKGRCESFGQGGDGYVPGEGVGAVLLKPFKKAVADGDHIYGIIKGMAINHGGRTNGYTVPNPGAQAAVVSSALREAGVNPRTVSYIEAHGTGTSLGDPIEIAGLSKAFEAFTKDRQYCAIGSVKSNIGHAESAAGIAGLTKVLLQMKYGRLVPSLHADTLNPHIDFGQTPFAVQRKLADWKRAVFQENGSVIEYPRIAGLSSFGAGGSNAHMVLEEYVPENRERSGPFITAQDPALIVLSARNEQQLRERAKRLHAAIGAGSFTDDDLPDIAYTLQVGREALEERLGFTALTVHDMEDKLNGFLDGREDIADIYRGNRDSHKAVLSLFADDEELKEAAEKWIKRKKYGKLLDFWVKGTPLDWRLLYGSNMPRRVSLPTYPFAEERYWVSGGSAVEPETPAGFVPALHPLLQQNDSTFEEISYSSFFTGEEFFLRDHVVQGRAIMPGAVQLEMARAAVKAALDNRPSDLATGNQTGVRLYNVRWMRPLAVDEPLRVRISLTPEEDGSITFDLFGGQEEREPVRYSRGSAALHPLQQEPSLDLPFIRQSCSLDRYNSQDVYDAFESIGIDYGPRQRAIQQLYAGHRQVLTKLVWPEGLPETPAPYILHPSLLDAALQGMLGLGLQDAGKLKLMLPEALQELYIYGALDSSMWAWVRYRDINEADIVDVDVCDEAGRVLVQMKGITCAELPGVRYSAEDNRETLMLHAQWKEQPVTGRQGAAAEIGEHWVVLCDPKAEWVKRIEGEASLARCLVLNLPGLDADEKYRGYAKQLFEQLQLLLRARPERSVLIQLVVPLEADSALCAALGALIRTANAENPRILGQVLEVGEDTDAAALTALLIENRQSPHHARIRYEDAKRFIHFWKESTAHCGKTAIPWKKRGVYLITGGAGGLGRIVARDIAERCGSGVLILTGRSPISAEKEAELTEIAASGAEVVYRQMDITDFAAARELIAESVERYGGINGIIHSAGVKRDSYMIHKSCEEFDEVLAPKVTGLMNIDKAAGALNLDFFVMFSSIAGVVGNPGQADYAAANAFMDAYADYRSSLVAQGKRKGQTLSINWPLWAEGGMRVNPDMEAMMAKHTGMSVLKSSEGLLACYRSLASGWPQMLVLHGGRDKLRQFINGFESGEEGSSSDHHFVKVTEKIASGEWTEEQFMAFIQMQ